MGSRHKRWIRLCLKLAQKSGAPDFKHGAVLVRGGKVIAHGTNNHKKPGYLADSLYGEKMWHSETDVLTKVRKERIDGAILYIAGLSKADNLLCSKPCKCCSKFIQKFNLKAVYYSDKDGTIIRWAG